MARVAPALPISPKLFRNFAVITLVFTGCIAMFTNGEGQQAIEEQIKERQQKNELLIAEAQTVGSRTIGLGRSKTAGSAVSDAIASAESGENDIPPGTPMDSAGGSGSDDSASSRGPMGRYIAPLPSAATNHYSGQKSKTAGQPQRPTQDQLQRLLEASRRRSGGGD